MVGQWDLETVQLFSGQSVGPASPTLRSVGPMAVGDGTETERLRLPGVVLRPRPGFDPLPR